MSLDSQTLQQVKDGLLRCGPMHSQQGLSAVFVDKRVAPWRNLIPEASSPAERTDRLIERLHDSYDQHDQNALVLFCTVLADNTDPAVACHDRLKQLAALVQREVDRSRNIPDARQTWPVGRRLTTSISLAVAVLGILIVAGRS